MGKKNAFRPEGVIPATLLMFNSNFQIDWNATRKHIRDVARTHGLSAITVNGHSSEVHACSFGEQQQLLADSLDEVGDILPIINGVYADSSLIAQDIAIMADKEGASALLIFPPGSMLMGGHLRPEMAITHFKMIAEVTDLPLILFEYPMTSGLGYTIDTMDQIFDSVPTVVAIKDWSNNPMLHEAHINGLQSRQNPVNVLSTHSSWLMASLSMQPAGLLSGSGSVIPGLHVALFQALKKGDLIAAQQINRKIYPLAQEFYKAPFLDMHNRMKECLVLLGKSSSATVRPPLVKLEQKEITNLKKTLMLVGFENIY